MFFLLFVNEADLKKTILQPFDPLPHLPIFHRKTLLSRSTMPAIAWTPPQAGPLPHVCVAVSLAQACRHHRLAQFGADFTKALHSLLRENSRSPPHVLRCFSRASKSSSAACILFL